jgi:hypothetical protein
MGVGGIGWMCVAEEAIDILDDDALAPKRVRINGNFDPLFQSSKFQKNHSVARRYLTKTFDINCNFMPSCTVGPGVLAIFATIEIAGFLIVRSWTKSAIFLLRLSGRTNEAIELLHARRNFLSEVDNLRRFNMEN